MTRALRPHQERAIAELRQALTSGKRCPVLHLPTGAGKTRVAGEIISRATAKGKRVVFVVPAISLVDQTVASLYADGVTDVGVIQADHPLTDYSKPVQVASIQTVSRRGFPQADLVLVDECHQLFTAQKKWMSHPEWTKVPFLGLSATPWTKGLGKHYDHLISSVSTQDLIDAGYLSTFRVFAPDHPDLSGVKIQAGDYQADQLADTMNKAPLVANVVETWIRQGEWRPTLCFAVNRAHAKHLQQQFEDAGIPCGYIDAFTEAQDRKIVQGKFSSGEYKVVCNVGTLTTGVDWIVRCIVLARPTRSEMLFTQIIGRGLRPEYAPGFDLETQEGRLAALAAGPKADGCLILDHSDTHNRLGFVTDINHDRLDDGTERNVKRERREALPRECPKCAYMRPAKVRTCPNCGFKPEAISNVDHGDGELTEVIRGKGTRATGPKNHIRMGGQWIPLADFYGQLKAMARDRGYKEGWAAQQYKKAAGTWPNAYRDAPALPVSTEVSAWVKSRQIAYAKARGGQRSVQIEGGAHA